MPCVAPEISLQALLYKLKHRVKDAPPMYSSCSELGTVYGVGIGLYFQTIAWLRQLLLWLAIASVPFLVVINSSQFTTEQYKRLRGVTVLPTFNPLQSFTFAAIMDDMRIAAVDAASMAVFSIACMVLYKSASRFARDIDDATMEVSDYTVIVKGLPETTPIDIGRHFARFGQVMDVVMVKDFGPLLQLASTATALEQKRRAAEGRLERGGNAVAYQRRVRSAQQKMAKFMQEANKQIDSSGFSLKAVFVTFNKQGERAACQAGCPKGWAGSWLQRKGDRFLGRYRFWVEQAKPPEDYIYENLHHTRASRWIRVGIVRLAVLVVLLISAAAVSKLMAINITSARNITWDKDAMVGSISGAMKGMPIAANKLADAWTLGNETLKTIITTNGDAAAQALLQQPGAAQRLQYCSLQLQQLCSTRYSTLLGTNITIAGAEAIQWGDPADALLKAPDLQKAMQDCSRTPGCALSMCYPCYCSLLSEVASGKVVDGELVLSIKQQCAAFISTLDVKAYVIKGVISMVIVVLNIALKAILQVLVRFEKHWTQSDQETAYAVLAFVSQLLNSVLVLLLVNAHSSVASSIIMQTLSGSQTTSWGSNLIMTGPYADFSTAWYADVGQSLQLIIILNAVLTGLPGLYLYGLVWLVVVDVVDRWYLCRMCQRPVRYGKNLPYMLLGVLPWAAASHCAFGLWMHTHFFTGSTGNKLASIAGSRLTEGSASAALEYVKQTYVWQRITQANGLPLLILLLVHLVVHVYIRLLMYCASGKAFKSCASTQDDGAEIEVTYAAALLSANSSSGPSMLAGAPTYRMPHHPRYRDMFDNAMYKPIWFKAFGRLRYTQVVSRPQGRFQIAPEVVLEHDQSDMEETISSMPEELQAAARRLADGSDGDGDGKPRKSLKPRTGLPSVLTTPRVRSQTVTVAVLAGLHESSPRARSASCAVPPGLSPRLLTADASGGVTWAESSNAEGFSTLQTSPHFGPFAEGGSFGGAGGSADGTGTMGTSLLGSMWAPVAAAADAESLGIDSVMVTAPQHSALASIPLVAGPRMSAMLTGAFTGPGPADVGVCTADEGAFIYPVGAQFGPGGCINGYPLIASSGCSSSDGEQEEEEKEEQRGRNRAATTAVCADVQLGAGPGALSDEGGNSGDGTVAHGNNLGSPTSKLPIKQRKKHRKKRKKKN
eukprot:gene11394-11542_t